MKILLLGLALLVSACDGRGLENTVPADLAPCGALGQPCCAGGDRCAAPFICLPAPGSDESAPWQCYQPVPR